MVVGDGHSAHGSCRDGEQDVRLHRCVSQSPVCACCRKSLVARSAVGGSDEDRVLSRVIEGSVKVNDVDESFVSVLTATRQRQWMAGNVVRGWRLLATDVQLGGQSVVFNGLRDIAMSASTVADGINIIDSSSMPANRTCPIFHQAMNVQLDGMHCYRPLSRPVRASHRARESVRE